MDMKALGGMVLLGSLVTGCAGPGAVAVPTPDPTPTHIGTLTFIETTCTFESAAATVTAGPISLAVLNRTKGDVIAVVVQIAPGHTFDDFAADVQNAKRTAEAGLRLDPEPPSYMLGLTPVFLGPRGSTTITQTALAATHGIMCNRTYEATGQVAPYAYVGPIEVRPR